MKIQLFGTARARAISAALRNCLTRAGSTQYCEVRKCRRDGCCTGPLTCFQGGRSYWLAFGPADKGGDGLPAPICWRSLPEQKRKSINTALWDLVDEGDKSATTTIIENTRALSGRRWLRIMFRP